MADERVATASRYWEPRFVAQGVDASDVRRTLARIGRWEDWCREWGETAREYEALAEAAEGQGRRLTAAEAWRRAALCWHFGKFVFVDDPDQLRAASERTWRCYQRGAGGLRPPAERVLVPYAGVQLPALLRRPERAERPPVVVMLPGLDSVKEELQTTADLFLERGLATLAVDGPGQGETESVLPIEPAYEHPVRAVIDWLERRPEVDAGRVGLYGVSLGGYYAVRTAAFEPRVRAAVDLAGTYSLEANWEQRSAISRAAFRLRSGAASDEEARERARLLDLAGVAERVAAPLLVVHGRLDPIAPIGDAERVAAEAPAAELVVFDDGNHGLTNRVFACRTLMGDWLRERL